MRGRESTLLYPAAQCCRCCCCCRCCADLLCPRPAYCNGIRIQCHAHTEASKPAAWPRSPGIAVDLVACDRSPAVASKGWTGSERSSLLTGPAVRTQAQGCTAHGREPKQLAASSEIWLLSNRRLCSSGSCKQQAAYGPAAAAGTARPVLPSRQSILKSSAHSRMQRAQRLTCSPLQNLPRQRWRTRSSVCRGAGGAGRGGAGRGGAGRGGAGE